MASKNLTHSNVWRAIDLLAAKHGMSVSRLARRAGLDPTTFNISKRFGPDGKPRWPSTETIALILAATGEPLVGFISMTGPVKKGSSRRPLARTRTRS
jgi:phage repressor protein C with HTH and peptisase S24 domain